MKRNLFIAGLLFFIMACQKEKSAKIQDNATSRPYNVSIKNSAYSPTPLYVVIKDSANATVTWRNDDNTVHTVTSDDGIFSSGDIAPGGQFSYTFRETGTFGYHCSHHTGMTGIIVAVGIR